MGTSGRLILVAGLVAILAGPYTFLSDYRANAAEAPAGSAVLEADDSGPLPAWWAQTVYGEPRAQAAPSGMARGPARTVTEGATPREPLHFISEGTAGH